MSAAPVRSMLFRDAFVRRARGVAACVVGMVAALSCDDAAGPRDVQPDAASFVVAAQVTAASDEVYVSLPPATLPRATEATLRVERTGVTTRVPLLDGGFDPVVLRAQVGDVIAISVVVDGVAHAYAVVVRKPAGPVIVRTVPKPDKRDVPLNARMQVVFSEPVDPATVTAASVLLRRGGASVEGRLEFVDLSRLIVQFVPTVPLAAGTDYELVVTRDVRDLDGMALAASVSVPFTTSTPGALAGLTVSPGEGDLLVGQILALTAILRDASGHELSARQVTWRSSDPATASVSRSGMVAALKVGGPVTITATSEGVSGSASIMVIPGDGATGVLQVLTSTTGTDVDTSGYYLFFEERHDGAKWYPYPMPLEANGSRSWVMHAGTYEVTLTYVAATCAVTGGSTRQVTVSANATTEIAIDVTCSSLPPATPLSGGQLAFVRDDQIFLVNSDRTGLVQLTHTTDPVWNGEPTWSPDGRRIAFVSNRAGRPTQFGPGEPASDIFVMDADGSNVVQRTTSGDHNGKPTWSPDGRRIAFERLGGGSIDVYVMSADYDGVPPSVVVARPGYDAQPAWSPDGSRIAYVSDWTAYGFTADIYLVTPDGTTITQSTNGLNPSPLLVRYNVPAWSPDGRRLVALRCNSAPNGCAVGATLVTMNPDGSGVTTLSGTRDFAWPTWSADGRSIAFSQSGSIEWIAVDGSQRGIIVIDGYSPAWRP